MFATTASIASATIRQWSALQIAFSEGDLYGGGTHSRARLYDVHAGADVGPHVRLLRSELTNRHSAVENNTHAEPSKRWNVHSGHCDVTIAVGRAGGEGRSG